MKDERMKQPKFQLAPASIKFDGQRFEGKTNLRPLGCRHCRIKDSNLGFCVGHIVRYDLAFKYSRYDCAKNLWSALRDDFGEGNKCAQACRRLFRQGYRNFWQFERCPISDIQPCSKILSDVKWSEHLGFWNDDKKDKNATAVQQTERFLLKVSKYQECSEKLLVGMWSSNWESCTIEDRQTVNRLYFEKFLQVYPCVPVSDY